MKRQVKKFVVIDGIEFMEILSKFKGGGFTRITMNEAIEFRKDAEKEGNWD